MVRGWQIQTAHPRRPRRIAAHGEDARAQGELPVDYGWEPAGEVRTAYAGAPLSVRTLRSSDVLGGEHRRLRLKQRQRRPPEVRPQKPPGALASRPGNRSAVQTTLRNLTHAVGIVDPPFLPHLLHSPRRYGRITRHVRRGGSRIS